ncbi:MAG TPA: Hsp70 family protein [Streptosporangiaceae bacterium]
MANKVFGIDLGTTYSCIAHVDEYGRPAVIFNADSQPTTPSVVLFDSPTDVVVGVQAKRQARIRPDDVAVLVKRHMGESDWRFATQGQEYSAPAISSQVLRGLALDAARALAQPVSDVVITVPAYFGDEERKATKLAGELAGLNVVDIINEPTAAAFSYGFAQEGSTAQTVLVYDLGGGTFDSTVITLADNSITVVATDGDHALGGADWDDRLAQYLSQKFREAAPSAGDPLDDTYGAQDLITSAEDVKQALTGRESVDALVVFGADRASVTVSRQAFEELTSTLLDRTISLTQKVLFAAQDKGVTRIDKVLLVGGMSKMPCVARRLAEVFPDLPPAELSDPDLAVAKGAAIYGQKKELENYVISDLVAQGKLAEGQTIADANPVDLTKAVATTASEYGLASAAVADLVQTQISNVTSRGFGVIVSDRETNTEYVDFLAHANDSLPITISDTYYTNADDQRAVQIQVVEQATSVESSRPEDNKVIIEGMIDNIPAGLPRGTPVEVTFAMGRDQTIEVTARHSAVAEPLVLRLESGVSSAAMREEEQRKVDLLKPKA